MRFKNMDLSKKISGISPEELPARALKWGIRKAQEFFEELSAHIGGLEIKPSELPGLVAGDALTPSDAALRVLHGFAESAWISDHVVEIARNVMPEQVKSLIADTDKLVLKKFRIFGEEVDYSSWIRWHYDPKNDYEFKAGEFFRRLKIGSEEGRFDVKYVWELSRLQHFPRLALAYRLTGDKKYANALIEQTHDWIGNNPVGFGANWTCTMDISLRAANLAYAFAILGNFHFESDFAVELIGNLIAHGRFIGNHLEWSDEITGNHYLANLAGLAVLGCLLAPGIPEASDWVEFAQQELGAEIKKQVNPDGSDFEASTGYHRLALECFLIPAIFLDRIGKRMSKDYIAKLIHMGVFARDIAMPDGSFPLIGDNDSGLFMSLQPRPLSDLNYVIELTAAYTGDSLLKPVINIGRQIPETLWLTGEAGWVRWGEMRPTERPRTSEYQDGGIFIVKSSDLRDMCTFRLGPVGQKGAGGHAHNDQLSVTIRFNSKPIIVDPGTGCYTASFEKRNHYRLSALHSIISIDGEEQNRFSDDELFKIKVDVDYFFQGLDSYSDHSQIVGSIKGYGRWAKDEIGFSRIIRHDAKRRQFEILDEIEISEKIRDEIRGKLTWNFPLASGLTVESRGTGYLKLLNRDGELAAEVLFNPGWTVTMDETRFAPSYGIEEKNVTLRFKPIGEIFESHFIFRAAPAMSQTSIQE
jgi:hypothetical protein